MPIPAYISINGKKQGLITENAFTEESVGNKYVEGHENEVLVQAFEHRIAKPKDPQSGQPTGQRQHKELVITKIFDKSSPGLYQALTDGEVITECIIKWYRTNIQGKIEHYFTHKLEDALITEIHTFMPNCQDPSMEQFTHHEEVSFSYRKITWVHEITGAEGEDDWRAPNTA